MGFFLELSFSLLNTDLTGIKKKIMDKSVELRCDFSYQHIEYTKSKTYVFLGEL